MRYSFLKFTIVLVELAGALALAGGVVLVVMAVKSWGPGGGLHQAKLTLPDNRVIAFSDLPLVRFVALAPGIGSGLLGILMLGMGQLCEAVLQIEVSLRKGGGEAKQ